MPFEFSDALREVPVVLAQKGGARAKVNATAQVEVSLPCSYNTVEGVRRDKKRLEGDGSEGLHNRQGRMRGGTCESHTGWAPRRVGKLSYENWFLLS